MTSYQTTASWRRNTGEKWKRMVVDCILFTFLGQKHVGLCSCVKMVFLLAHNTDIFILIFSENINIQQISFVFLTWNTKERFRGFIWSLFWLPRCPWEGSHSVWYIPDKKNGQYSQSINFDMNIKQNTLYLRIMPPIKDLSLQIQSIHF